MYWKPKETRLGSGAFFSDHKNLVHGYQGSLMVPVGQYFLGICIVEQREDQENN